MRIALTTGQAYLPQRVGGSGTSTHDLVPALKQEGHKVAVLSELLPEGYIGYRTRILRKLQRAYGGRRIIVDHAMGYPVYRIWGQSEPVSQFIEQFRPDLAIIQAGDPLKFANKFIGLGIPAIVYLRDVEFSSIGDVLTPSPLLGFIANSQFTADVANSELGISSEVIPPLVQRDRYTTRSTREKLVFINPVPEKGLEIALQLADKRPDIPMLIVEAWPLNSNRRASLKKLLMQLPNVNWMPPQLDMRAVYRQARIILVPSQWREAWCRVVSEAQVSGIPALASRIGGLPESVGPGGVLVDPEAPISDWENALSQLWDDLNAYSKCSALALSHSHRENFQPQAIVQKLLNVIENHMRSSALPRR